MKRKKTKSAKKTIPKPRNPHAQALKESGLFRPKVVPAAQDVYRRRSKHPKAVVPDEDA